MTTRTAILGIYVGIVVSVLSVDCSADPTVQVSVPDDSARMYSQLLNTSIGVPFEVSVVVDADGHDVSRVRFAMTDLKELFPQVFRLDTRYPTPSATNALDEWAGQYDIVFNGCAPACQTLEVLRVVYLDMTGAIGEDTVLTVSGLGPVEAGAEPLVFDCDGVSTEAPMGGADASAAVDGCVWEPIPIGALAVNGTCVLRSATASAFTPYADCGLVVANSQESVGVMKARY